MHLEIRFGRQAIGQASCVRADVTGTHEQHEVTIGDDAFEHRLQLIQRLDKHRFDRSATAHSARDSTTVRAGRPRSGRATNMGFRIARGGGVADAQGAEPAVASAWNAEREVPGGRGAELFAENCAACHVEDYRFKGLYGTDQESLVRTIRDGGNNVMSMPAFADRMTPGEIDTLASWLREKNDW